MDNSLVNYLNRRFDIKKTTPKKSFNFPGPVITISREVGCNGLKLARLLEKRLNRKNDKSKWKVLSKEIFYQSAQQLNIHPELVRKTLKKTSNYTFEQILKAFSDKNYKSDRKIIKTVIDAVRSFAIDGNCIIVGRAGHIIAREITNSLHLRLIAPIDYRIATIMKNNGLSQAEAIRFINRVEEERVAFRKAADAEKLGDILFDLTINRVAFNDEQVADLIENAIDKKLTLKIANQKPMFV